MPRKELTANEREVLAENWKTFGRFLRAQRIMRGFTQKRAALAAKVSTRQWVRYEQGSRVLQKVSFDSESAERLGCKNRVFGGVQNRAEAQ